MNEDPPNARQYLCRVSDDKAVRDVTDATDFTEDEDGYVSIDGVDYYVEWRKPADGC